MSLSFLTDSKVFSVVKNFVSYSINGHDQGPMTRITETTVPYYGLQAAANVAIGLLGLAYVCCSLPSIIQRPLSRYSFVRVVAAGFALSMIWSGISGNIPSLAYTHDVSRITNG